MADSRRLLRRKESYPAGKLPKFVGPAAWSDILGPQPAPVILEQDTSADLVIIGGGFAGLSAAHRLRQIDPRLKVIVLEAARIAEGASGRNSGFMVDLPHNLQSDDYSGASAAADKDLIALNRQAIGFGRSAVQSYEIDKNYFDEVGKVNGAASGRAHEHNLSYAKHLEGLGESSRLLDQQDMYELTGSRHYLSGLYTPGTVVLQPGGYIRGLAYGLKTELSEGSAKPVEIYENSPVHGFARDGSGWVVQTKKATVKTSQIILATNGHLESFGLAAQRLMHIFLFASMTQNLDKDMQKRLGGQPRWGITPSDPLGSTIRRIDAPLGGERVITRTCAVMRPGLVPSKRDMQRAAAVHQQKFAQRFPQIKNVKWDYCWSGHLCLSLNDVSVMGEIDQGVFAACVQNGLGTTRGTLTGMGAADLAMGLESDITRYFAKEALPKKLPPQPFATWGANIWMRFREWRAANE